MQTSKLKALFKLRTSDHKLEIETGRHNNTPLSRRIYTFCESGSIENEQHFISECPIYSTLRVILYDSIAKEIPDFINFNRQDNLKSLL